MLRERRLTCLRALRLALLLCLAALGLPALALPTDVILVLDNSGSMRKNDPEFLLKRAVSKFVSDLGSDTRVGMIVFDEKVDYAVPLADLGVDTRAALKGALEGIDYRGQFTNSPGAIERAIYELKSDGREDVARVIIFMTDGIVDTGDAGADQEKTKWMREELAADAADNDIRMFGIAFTENADFFLIQSLAKRTEGEYFRALTPADLAGVFDSVQASLAAPPPAPEPVAPPPPPPPPPSGPAASCLDTLIPEERIAIEESAGELGLTPEAMCEQMMSATPGSTVVMRPQGEGAPLPEEERMGLVLVLGLAALVLLLLVVIVVVLLRRRRGGAGAPAATDPAAVPDAFLKDVNGITGEPAIKIGEKPVMIGRVAGNDPAHLDYYVVDKGTVGRRHAIIQYRDFAFWLTDQGSVNGTFLNGERIDGERQLKHGDRVKFHKYEFEFSMPEMDDAGHTVFADPGDVEATIIAGAAELAAAGPAAAADDEPGSDDVFDLTAGGAAPDVAEAGDATREDDDIFDDETALSARHAAEQAAPAEEPAEPMDDLFDEDAATALPAGGSSADSDLFDDEAATALPAAGAPQASDLFDDEAATAVPGVGTEPLAVVGDESDGPEDADPMPEATSDDVFGGETVTPQPDDDFDAEASAFFDSDDFGQTSEPPVDPDFGTDFDEGPTAMPDPPPPAADDDVDPESATLVPGDAYGDPPLEGTSDISLDEFMRTDSFDAPLAGFEDDDSEDATLMPEQVTPAEPSVPAIDDVFDITGNRTIPPPAPEDDDDAEDDDSEAPTRFRS